MASILVQDEVLWDRDITDWPLKRCRFPPKCKHAYPHARWDSLIYAHSPVPSLSEVQSWSDPLPLYCLQSETKRPRKESLRLVPLQTNPFIQCLLVSQSFSATPVGSHWWDLLEDASHCHPPRIELVCLLSGHPLLIQPPQVCGGEWGGCPSGRSMMPLTTVSVKDSSWVICFSRSNPGQEVRTEGVSQSHTPIPREEGKHTAWEQGKGHQERKMLA